MTDVFDEVKRLVPVPEAVRLYGFEPSRAGFIRCPFHHEKTPSLKVYPARWHCFGCGAGGSVIDFVGKLYGLTPLEAVRKLDNDFRIGLPLDTPMTQEERRKAKEAERVRAVYQDFQTWRDDTIRALNAAIRTANAALKSWDPSELLPHEALAVRWREYLEDTVDTLSRGTMTEQMEIFRDRKKVMELCERILQATPMKSQAA